jgi:hypothetical protein
MVTGVQTCALPISLKTANGARTITCDPKTHQVYLPCNVSANGENVFSVLVVGAAKP